MWRLGCKRIKLIYKNNYFILKFLLMKRTRYGRISREQSRNNLFIKHWSVQLAKAWILPNLMGSRKEDVNYKKDGESLRSKIITSHYYILQYFLDIRAWKKYGCCFSSYKVTILLKFWRNKPRWLLNMAPITYR